MELPILCPILHGMEIPSLYRGGSLYGDPCRPLYGVPSHGAPLSRDPLYDALLYRAPRYEAPLLTDTHVYTLRIHQKIRVNFKYQKILTNGITMGVYEKNYFSYFSIYIVSREKYIIVQTLWL